MFKKLTKALAFLLVFCMMVSLFPVGVLATDVTDAELQTEVTEPAEDDTQDAETPADEGTPSDEETPAEEETPTDQETPAEEETPTDEETPSDEETPADEETPTDEETPAEEETPADEETTEEEPNPEDAVQPLSEVPDVAARDTSNDAFYKIVHLDCGRKYFSKDWIVALLYEMKADGYNQLQLAFGNDGLRFLLDDMSFEANDTNYTHDAVVAAVEAANKAQNSSGDERWLTQTEMTSIIETANSLGIEIVPLLNLPGHANAILDIAGDQYNVSGSQNTLDVTKPEAVNFAMAIFQKYVDYFDGQGCKFFNFGADEYANDTNPSQSFGSMSQETYSCFVTFINRMASCIKTAGMTPRAFNDGLYYGSYNTSTVSIDTAIQCCYWSSGWSGYDVAAASTIANNGHSMINTHGDYYYVLGKDSPNFEMNDPDYTNAQGFSNTAFAGNKTINNPAGAMFCIWCDYPNAENETEVAENTRLVLRAMALRMDDQLIDNMDTSVVANGFNEDGTINDPDAGTGEPEPAPVPNDTITLTVGESAQRILEGNLTENVTVQDSEIANATAEYKEIQGGTTVADTAATTLTSGSQYVIGDGSDHYLKLNNSNIESTSNPNDATVWTVGGSDGNWTLKSGDYYLTHQYNQLNAGSNATTNHTWSFSGSNGFYYQASWRSYYLSYYQGWLNEYWTVSTSEKNAKAYPVTNEPGTEQTTITFTGVAPGTTYVTVGETVYEIVVNHKTDTVNVLKDQSTTVAVSGELNDSKLDKTLATVTVTNGQMTVTGVDVGTTQVTVGDTIYTITVTEEDLSAVNHLTVEYWITNSPTKDANGKTTATVAATDAYLEEGIAVTDIAPGTTTKEDRTLQYWRCRLLDTTKSNSSTNGTEKQTEDSGDDETYSGTEFTKVRYWGGTWSVYTTDQAWVQVESKHQLVAYYLEILPVADELIVTAADWGKKGDGSTTGYHTPGIEGTLSVRVVYEDSTTNPKTTTAADLKSRTIVYDHISGGRGIGTLNLTGLEGYQIWKVEAETGSESGDGEMWGTYTVTNFTWDNNPMTVYEGDPVDSYVIHNDAHNPTRTDYYQNLLWDEIHEAILITVYVKAKPTEDTLKVVYYDEKFNDELYHYDINVVPGVTFAAINPTPGQFAGDPDRIDVTGCYITNAVPYNQYFQTDLTQVPEAVGKYNSALYTYNGSEIKDDGKTLYLYYTINTDVLSPIYMIDFGQPITFPLSAVANSVETVEAVSVKSDTRYGTLSYNSSDKTFTYQPDETLENIDVLTIHITFDGQPESTTNVGVMPATTVYYEEGFANLSGFTGGSKGTVNQELEVAGKHTHNYGFDPAYASENGASNTTQAISDASGSTATFTFTGTGVDIYTNSTPDSGRLMIQLTKDGKTVRLIAVETALKNGDSTATNFQEVDGYNVPVTSITGLERGAYTVKITHVKDADGSASTVNLDGFRVYGTLENQANDYYTKDSEDSPIFIELRDQVLASMNAASDDSEQYAEQIAKNLYSQVYATGNKNGGIIISANDNYDQDDLTDLLDNGPKNEIYLRQNQSLVFKVTTAREVQIGLKALNAATDYSVLVGNDTVKSGELTASTDMFYTVLDKGSSGEQTITITNNGDGILSITKLKICDDPNATFAALTEEDLIPALLSLGFEEDSGSTTEPTDPVEPVEPTDPTDPTDPEEPGSSVTDPEEPTTDPEEPSTDPEEPSTDPEEPDEPEKPNDSTSHNSFLSTVVHAVVDTVKSIFDSIWKLFG